MDEMLREALGATTAIGGRDGGGTIVALLDADVAVRGPVIGRLQLEFGPGGGDEPAALDAAFEAEGEADEGFLLAGYGHGFQGLVEIRARGAVAVPVVVEEEIGVVALGSVVEYDAGLFAVIVVTSCRLNCCCGD